MCEKERKRQGREEEMEGKRKQCNKCTKALERERLNDGGRDASGEWPMGSKATENRGYVLFKVL